MKIFYSIVFSVALIVIITAGLKRSNAFFRQNNAMGDVNYLTPATQDTQSVKVPVDSLKGDSYTESELVHVSEK